LSVMLPDAGVAKDEADNGISTKRTFAALNTANRGRATVVPKLILAATARQISFRASTP